MIIAKQKSALSGFAYEFFDAASNLVGTLRLPDFAQAKNARLKNPEPKQLTSDIEIVYRGKPFLVEFEYLKRAWFNDIRFTLTNNGVRIATIDATRQKGWFRRAKIAVTEPFVAEVIRKRSLFSMRYELRRASDLQGTIAEKMGLKVRREINIDLPSSIAIEIQLFIFFVVFSDAYS
jgi:hypothetical protein